MAHFRIEYIETSKLYYDVEAETPEEAERVFDLEAAANRVDFTKMEVLDTATHAFEIKSWV